MERLNEYRITYAKHSYKEEKIEAENIEDAKYIAKLRCPKGYDVLSAIETTDSIFDRIEEKNRL